MNQRTAILVDDEVRGLSALEKLLVLNCPEIHVIGKGRNADEAQSLIEQLHPDLVFLDIAMPGRSVFDMLGDLKSISFEIIFVTAHHQFMLQAFQYSAVDYLLKPVDEERLVEAVARAVSRKDAGGLQPNLETLLHNVSLRQQPTKHKLCIPSMRGFQVIEIRDILYCEADSNYTNFHILDRSIICASKSIQEYDNLLADAGFIRIHKSFLVNIDHVAEYVRGDGGSVLLTNGKTLEVSRRKKDILIQRMKAHYRF